MLSYQSREVVQKTLIQAFWDIILCCWLNMVPSIPLKCQAVTSPTTQHHIPDGLRLQQYHCEHSNPASYAGCVKDLLTHCWYCVHPYLLRPVYVPSPHSVQLLHYSAMQVFICPVCEIHWFMYCQILSSKLKVSNFSVMWVPLILYSMEAFQLSAAVFCPLIPHVSLVFSSKKGRVLC
jgi:hypothetical protein